MNPKRFPQLVLVIAIAGLAGCVATTATKPEPAPEPVAKPVIEAPPVVEKVPSPSEIALVEGLALYNKGDYNGAIKRFAAVSETEKPAQLSAYKYTAFSYCVTGRQALCKQNFEKALKLEPSFDLDPGEKGHPLWGPVFDRVKKGK